MMLAQLISPNMGKSVPDNPKSFKPNNCSTNRITPPRTTLTDTMTDLEPELIDVLKLLGWHEL